MSYIISFGNNASQMWSIANRYTNRFLELLEIEDDELKEYVEMSININGISLYIVEDNFHRLMKQRFYNHLCQKLPEIINKLNNENDDLFDLFDLFNELNRLISSFKLGDKYGNNT
ncbi:MAG: hypothetical protein GY754_08335 [bacterium]|nr:hypothetical protein [bacterium]